MAKVRRLKSHGGTALDSASRNRATCRRYVRQCIPLGLNTG